MQFGNVREGPNTPEEAESGYYRTLRMKKLWIIVFAITTVGGFFYSLFSCQIESITAGDVIDVVVAHLTGGTAGYELADTVVWQYNMPRAIMGVFVGISLAVGGAIMQVIMRNPLATPYTTGVSAGASMGAALCIYLDIALISTGNVNTDITINAIVFAMFPTAAILLVARQKHITPTTMILAGIAMMYIFSASTTLMMLMAPNPETVETAYRWTVGSLGRVTWENLWIVIVSVVACVGMLMYISKQIHLMNAGQRTATTLGVDVRLYRNLGLLITAVMTAVVVGVTGGIGFMGLIAPHLARILVGSDLKYMLPTAAGIGATILLVADAFAKTVIQQGIPVGVITSVIGGPIFVMILIKSAKKVWY
ncbi:MAG: iron ABC transporter permease [Thermoplasmata archaeon]|nr:iron ABC transporter permease [Thermoplasmata archaeon]